MTDAKRMKASSKQAGKRIGGTIGIFIFLLILGLFMALPIYLAIVMSIKPVQELFIFPPKLYAISPTLDNFRDMFSVMSEMWVPFSRYVFNSVFVTVTVTLAQCIVASMAAFVLAKCRFPGSKVINSVIVISLLYTSNVIYIMQYIVMAKLNMIDTYWALILPSIASPMGLFLMRQSMSTMPDAMIEAAKVDGATEFQIDLKIVLPMMKNIIGTSTVLASTSMMQKLDIIMMTTNGGPGGRTMNMPMYLYQTALTDNNYGLANAQGVVLIVLGLCVVGLIRNIYRMDKN